MTFVIIFLLLAIALLAWAWVRGINSMNEKHPDYKGDDFLNWGKDKAPWENDEWDNQHHNEDV